MCLLPKCSIVTPVSTASDAAHSRHTISQLHRELRVVKDTDPVGFEIPCHPIRIADTGQRPGDHYTVVAGQDPGNPIVAPVHPSLAHAVLPMTFARQATPDLLVPALPA